jgi:hypothetical protein
MAPYDVASIVNPPGPICGRPLYVLQVMWWLRLSQLKTYPPDPPEAVDFARRAGISKERVVRWGAAA